jgi:hypothetical protein
MRVTSLDVHCPRCGARKGDPCAIQQYGKLSYHTERWLEAHFTYMQHAKKQS